MEYGDVVRSFSERMARSAAPDNKALESIDGMRPCSVVLPGWVARETLQNEVFVAGMPFAAVPVESLYKPWSTAPGNAFGAQKGLYLGESARHIQSVFAQLDIEVPERFTATPDHLSLLIELLATFLEAGNRTAAANLASDHFDWLSAYDGVLLERLDAAKGSADLGAERQGALVAGIEHVRVMVAAVQRLSGAIAALR